MSIREALIAHFGEQPFTRSDAIRAGFSDSQLERAAPNRPFRGVLSFGDCNDLAARTRAYSRQLRPGRAVTGLAAAELRGWPIPRRFRETVRIEVAYQTGGARPAGRSVVPICIRQRDWSDTEIRDVRVTSAPLTLLVLSRSCTPHELVVLMDAAVTRSSNYPKLVARGESTLEELRRSASQFASAHGRAAFAWAADRARVGAESPFETLLRLSLVHAGLPEPELQHEVRDGGRLVAVLDLAYPELRIAIEYEGDHHRTSQAQWRRDIERTRMLQALGWRVIRVTARDLFAGRDELLLALRRHLAAAASA